MDKLMARLGYESYFVQGGDWGSFLTRIISRQHAAHVKAIHLNLVSELQRPLEQNMFPAFGARLLYAGDVKVTTRLIDAISPDQEGFSPHVRAALVRRKQFLAKESAYLALHATKPHTIGVRTPSISSLSLPIPGVFLFAGLFRPSTALYPFKLWPRNQWPASFLDSTRA